MGQPEVVREREHKRDRHTGGREGGMGGRTIAASFYMLSSRGAGTWMGVWTPFFFREIAFSQTKHTHTHILVPPSQPTFPACVGVDYGCVDVDVWMILGAPLALLAYSRMVIESNRRRRCYLFSKEKGIPTLGSPDQSIDV